MTTERVRLPNRRYHESFQFVHDSQIYTVGIGRYPDGRLAEMFLDCGKSGTAVQTHARDSAVLVSLLVQHGVSLAQARHSLTRLPDDRASGPIGALLDLLAGEEPPPAAPLSDCPLERAGLRGCSCIDDVEKDKCRRRFLVAEAAVDAARLDRCICAESGVAAPAAGCDACDHAEALS